MASMAKRLVAARERLFVGRDAELATFEAVITARELPVCVFWIFGPGGVGKSTLLRALDARCACLGIPTHTLDGGNIEPNPRAFGTMLRQAMALREDADLAAGLGDERRVLIVDTYETLAPLDDWLRDELFPLLPAETLVVIAGRYPPGSSWLVDPAWQSLTETIELGNLSAGECAAYLRRRGLDGQRAAEVQRVTGGHPLALSLVAELLSQRRDARLTLDPTEDLVPALLARLLREVPGTRQRTVLEAAALVRSANEALLGEMLAETDIHPLWEWLRGLSFADAGPNGLQLHDLARDALVADLRWRNPDLYGELHRRARGYYARRVYESSGADQQRVLFDYLFLHRDNMLVRPYMQWRDGGTAFPDGMGGVDRQQLCQIVAWHEGEASATLAAYWFERQPENVLVYRDATGEPAAFLQRVDLERCGESDGAADPAVAAAHKAVSRHAALGSGERAALFRFWMSAADYQNVSALQSLIFVNIAQFYINTPGLAYSLVACADPEFYTVPFGYVDLERVSSADFEVGGRRYGVFGHDWRTTPAAAWLDRLAEREIAAAPLFSLPRSEALPRDDWDDAVRRALLQLARPDALRTSPLMRTRLVAERSGPAAGDGERAETLALCLRRAIDDLAASPREAKWYRALYHTYVRPAPTQERAAELIDVPFSSYRRHLKAGAAQVAETLWRWEREDAHGAAAQG